MDSTIYGHPGQTAHTTQLKKLETKQKLTDVVRGAHDVLFTAKGVFPFAFFPDTVTIDREKLTITHRTFFQVAEVLSIAIKDILNITANIGPFFGSIKLATRVYNEEVPYEVHYFWRDDALRVKRIVQGYIIAKQQKIDCSALSTKELARLLDKLGEEVV
jgi:hypothetical protein